MKLFNRAQSTIEFATITALVLGGIYLMGPILIRNISGYFKYIEDQAEVSMTEEIQQAPPTGLNIPSCECGELQFCGCGTGDPSQCARTEEFWCKSCHPPGCEYDLLLYFGLPVFECRAQVGCPASCCDDWIPSTICGAPCPSPEEMQFSRTCGQSCTETRCFEHEDCAFSCTLPCSNGSCTTGVRCKDLGDIDDEENLPGNTPYTAVAACTAAKCEMKVPLIMSIRGPAPPQWPPTPSNSQSCDQIDPTLQLFATCPTDYLLIGGGMTTIPIWTFPNLPPDTCNASGVYDISWIVNKPDLALNHWRCAANNWDPVCYAMCARSDAVMPLNGIIDSMVMVFVTSPEDQVTTAFCPAGMNVVSGGIITLFRTGWTWPPPPPPPLPPSGDPPPIEWFVSRPTNDDDGWECGLDDYQSDCYAFCAPVP